MPEAPSGVTTQAAGKIDFFHTELGFFFLSCFVFPARLTMNKNLKPLPILFTSIQFEVSLLEEWQEQGWGWGGSAKEEKRGVGESERG